MTLLTVFLAVGAVIIAVSLYYCQEMSSEVHQWATGLWIILNWSHFVFLKQGFYLKIFGNFLYLY
ncbi:hypothetical protein LSH36_275g06046 [Paralvinella palmiformis]|uniref:Uncharacterized protein n=1 Tax=Paralvinella palmiformis TaxID=53620 RepID=A0AAD9N2C8_9ANNE|nr:hypothetical protein LSH36_275g06046 [Paralvinella palmiformis]